MQTNKETNTQCSPWDTSTLRDACAHPTEHSLTPTCCLNSNTICCVSSASCLVPSPLSVFATWGNFQKWESNDVAVMSYSSVLTWLFIFPLASLWREEQIAIKSKRSQQHKKNHKLGLFFFFFSLFSEWYQDSSLAFKRKYIRPLRRKTEQTHNWARSGWLSVSGKCEAWSSVCSYSKGTQALAEKGRIMKKRSILHSLFSLTNDISSTFSFSV